MSFFIQKIRTLKWYTITEVLAFVYIILSPLFAYFLYLVFDQDLTTAASEIIGRTLILVIISPIGVVTVYGILRWRFGKNDYRLKLTSHILPAIISVAMVTLYSFTFAPPPDQETAILLLIRQIAFTIPLVVHIVSAFYASFAISAPYIKEFEILKNQTKEDLGTARLTNPELLQDTIYGDIAHFINEILMDLTLNVETMRSSTELINSTAHTLSINNEELAVSTDEISTTTTEMAKAASEQASQLNFILNRTAKLNTMLNDILTQIINSTRDIQEIAKETKFLALNARIEASRAGAAGKGFSVVAEDVRSLSDQTSEIVTLVQKTVDTITGEFATEVSMINLDLEGVASISEETAASSEEIAATMTEIKQNIDHINSLNRDLLENIKDNDVVFDRV